MKKFISMVMAAAMVVTMVPATAFAANTASFKVVDDYEITAEEAKTASNLVVTGTQVQLKLTDVDSEVGVPDTFEVELKFEGAEFTTAFNPATVGVYRAEDNNAQIAASTALVDDGAIGDDKVEFSFTEGSKDFRDGDIVIINLGGLTMTKDKVNHVATVKVTGDFGTSDEMVFASIVGEGIDVELDDEVVDVAEEEIAELEDIVIEPAAGTDFDDVMDTGNQVLKLKLSKGFEFANNKTTNPVVVLDDAGNVLYTANDVWTTIDEDEIEIEFARATLASETEITVTGLEVEATTAKAGDVATLTVKLDDMDSVKVEVAQVVDFTVVMSVDEDEDVPVFYSGVNVANTGLTVDDDHEALEVTLEETFAGAWSMHKDFTLTLPEGVHVTAVDATDENGTLEAGTLTLEDNYFAEAYQEGDHESFVFEKRTFEETASDKSTNGEPVGEKHEMTFVLTLVADPDFVGDVVLTLEGDAVDTQEVTIAKFVAPYTVKAEQNDLKIDYRYTEVPTDIVITEAEAGLWAENLEIAFAMDRDYIAFEDDAVFTVNEESDMEIDDEFEKTVDGVDSQMGFVVEEESDEEAAVITISGIELFMQRNIPAGAYDLEVLWNSATAAFEAQGLYAPDVHTGAMTTTHEDDCDDECYVADVCDYSDVVKEGWINVVTAGREQDDASFTTKVVVPVGEAYIIAGEAQVALDVPAYVSAAGYTMLPVRAVATALGINNSNVLWDQATKTVTILYGQRIITMTVGAKVINVNGSAIPASASVEVVDGRTFLPMRDLATALGVTDITWDAATKTATLNGNV